MALSERRLGALDGSGSPEVVFHSGCVAKKAVAQHRIGLRTLTLLGCPNQVQV